MRKHGCTMEFAAERSISLLAAYRQEMKNTQTFNTRSAAEAAVRYPAPRFWVSEERAVTVVSKIQQGLPILAKMNACKQRMYEEIARRVADLSRIKPKSTLTQLVSEVIYEPAPEHYLQPYSALQIIYNEKKRQRNARK